MPINVRKIGDWNRVRKMLEEYPQMVPHVQTRVKQLGDMLLQNIRSQVEAQGLNLAPLSPEYAKRKISEGLDRRILIATNEYIGKLRVEEQGKGLEYSVLVGAFEGDTHDSSGLDMSYLAEYLEMGTSRMPARPHMSPVWQKMRLQVEKEITQVIINKLKG